MRDGQVVVRVRNIVESESGAAGSSVCLVPAVWSLTDEQWDDTDENKKSLTSSLSRRNIAHPVVFSCAKFADDNAQQAPYTNDDAKKTKQKRIEIARRLMQK